MVGTLLKATYEVGSDGSKFINKELLDDPSGNSICYRIGKGGKEILGVPDDSLNDFATEQVVHLGLIAGFKLFFSKDKGQQILGILLFAFLAVCYLIARRLI